MLTEKQIERMLDKLRRFEDTLNPMLFKKVGRIDSALAYETLDRLYEIPDSSLMTPVESGGVRRNHSAG